MMLFQESFRPVPYSGAKFNQVRQLGKRLKATCGLTSCDLFLNSLGVIEINVIVAPPPRNEGRGTRAMEQIAAFADRHGCILALSPAEEGDHRGTTSKERLIKFYGRFGFVENRGLNYDRNISAKMWRKPMPRYNRDLAGRMSDHSACARRMACV